MFQQGKMLPDRVWQVGATLGENTAGLEGHKVLTEEETPSSKRYNNNALERL